MILRKALLKSFCPNLGKLNLSSFTNGQRFSISSTEKKEMIVLTARCEFTFPDSPVLCSNLPPASVCCRDNAPNSQEPFPSLQLCEFPTSFRNSPPVESRPPLPCLQNTTLFSYSQSSPFSALLQNCPNIFCHLLHHSLCNCAGILCTLRKCVRETSSLASLLNATAVR